MGRPKGVGRKHKAGVGNNKELPAAREIVRSGSKRPVDAGGDAAAEEPPKKRHKQAAPKAPERAQPKRSHKPKRKRPVPRGPPQAKPAQQPAAELLPEELEARHARDNKKAKRSHEKKVDAAVGEIPPLPGQAVYRQTKTGRERKGGDHAIAAGKKRVVDKIIDAVDAVGGSDALQAQALQDALEHPRLRKRARMAGYRPSEEVQVALFQQQQAARMVARASETAKPRGVADADSRSFVESYDVATAASPSKGGATSGAKRPSRNAIARASGRPLSTSKRRQRAAEAKRVKLTAREKGISWSQVRARKGFRKVTETMRQALHQWILDHPRVVQSPIANETIKVLNLETGLKERATKLLREVSLRELHNDLIELSVEKGGKGGGLPEARAEDGKILISATAMRYLLPPQLQAMTERHKQMCGCEICISADQLQQSLNAFRVRLKKQLLADVAGVQAEAQKKAAEERALAYQPSLSLSPPVPWHGKPGLALACIQCEVDPQPGIAFPHWGCVLRRCSKCPKYPIPHPG